MLKTNIGVLVSGGGTNLQALIDAQNEGIIKSGEIKLVISNKEDAYALERAKNNGISAKFIKKDSDFEKNLVSAKSSSGGSAQSRDPGKPSGPSCGTRTFPSY